MCGADGLEVAYLVDGGRKWPGRRRYSRARFTICLGCYSAGFDEEGRQLPQGRMRDRVYWRDVAGRGEQMPPTPCVNCGTVVIRNADPLLKRVTCSAACTTSLTRTRNGNKGSGQPCETCGQQIITGRADAQYCGNACRQKAYRTRNLNA